MWSRSQERASTAHQGNTQWRSRRITVSRIHAGGSCSSTASSRDQVQHRDDRGPRWRPATPGSWPWWRGRASRPADATRPSGRAEQVGQGEVEVEPGLGQGRPPHRPPSPPGATRRGRAGTGRRRSHRGLWPYGRPGRRCRRAGRGGRRGRRPGRRTGSGRRCRRWPPGGWCRPSRRRCGGQRTSQPLAGPLGVCLGLGVVDGGGVGDGAVDQRGPAGVDPVRELGVDVAAASGDRWWVAWASRRAFQAAPPGCGRPPGRGSR